MGGSNRQQMGEQAREVLLAEALGDLKDLVDLLTEADGKMKAYVERYERSDAQTWLSILDSKMQEFKHFQIPEMAAAKLQVHSETFLRGLMLEVKRLVGIEVERQSRNQKVVWGTALFLAGFAFATVLHLIF
jgi:hypothetical protein